MPSREQVEAVTTAVVLYDQMRRQQYGSSEWRGLDRKVQEILAAVATPEVPERQLELTVRLMLDTILLGMWSPR